MKFSLPVLWTKNGKKFFVGDTAREAPVEATVIPLQHKPSKAELKRLKDLGMDISDVRKTG